MLIDGYMYTILVIELKPHNSSLYCWRLGEINVILPELWLVIFKNISSQSSGNITSISLNINNTDYDVMWFNSKCLVYHI